MTSALLPLLRRAAAEPDPDDVPHADIVTITTVSDLSTFIEESRDGLLKEGGLGAIFAVVLVVFYLIPAPKKDEDDAEWERYQTLYKQNAYDTRMVAELARAKQSRTAKYLTAYLP